MKAIFTLSFLLSLLTSFAQTSGIRWERTFGGSGDETNLKSLATIDGNYLLASQTYSTNGDITAHQGSGDILLIKTTPDGQVLWKKTVGGIGDDYPDRIYNTPDGGYILVADVTDGGGDITGYHGPYHYNDLWVVKLSALGTLQWQRCIGGNQTETVRNVYIKNDGSVVLFGQSDSYDGDFAPDNRLADLFLCELSPSGVLTWLKRYGGADVENASDMVVKPNGHYLLAGSSASNNSGNVPAHPGYFNGWLVETDSAGTVIWSKTYGGSQNERMNAILQAGTSKYVCVLTSTSADGPVPNHYGSNDIWVMSLDDNGNIRNSIVVGSTGNDLFIGARYNPADSSILVNTVFAAGGGNIIGYHGGQDILLAKVNNDANIQWTKALGGSGNENLTAESFNGDGSIMFLANTNSRDGDVTNQHGKTDFWLGKIGGSGNLIWQKCLGGSEDDVSSVLTTDPHGGYTVIGTVTSKDGDVRDMHFGADADGNIYQDIWVCHVDELGAVQWQRSLGGYDDEYMSSCYISNGKYIITGYTYSADGDVVHNHGNWDIWMLSLSPSARIKGTVFIDNNSDGVQNNGEPFYDQVTVVSAKPGNIQAVVPYLGHFDMEIDTGSYIVAVHPQLPYYTAVRSSFNSVLSNYFDVDSVAFALQPISNKTDLRVQLIPLSKLIPGNAVSYKILYENIGTATISSGSVHFVKNRNFSLTSAVPSVASSINDTLVWNYASLLPGNKGSIILTFQAPMPPAMSINDTINTYASIGPVSDDLTPADDTAAIRQVAQNYSGPNDKTENNGGQVTSTYINSGKPLIYTIRFQNTGTDTAYNVVVRDTLDSKIDASSIQMIQSSHPCSLTLVDGHILVWTFRAIYLPEQAVNEALSHGYVSFSIKATGAHGGDVVHNTASIYFDFNDAVYTADASTKVTDVVLGLSSMPTARDKLSIYPNPSRGTLNVDITAERSGGAALVLINPGGQKVWTQSANLTRGQNTLLVKYPAGLAAGAYTLQVVQKDQVRYVQLVIEKE